MIQRVMSCSPFPIGCGSSSGVTSCESATSTARLEVRVDLRCAGELEPDEHAGRRLVEADAGGHGPGAVDREDVPLLEPALHGYDSAWRSLSLRARFGRQPEPAQLERGDHVVARNERAIDVHQRSRALRTGRLERNLVAARLRLEGQLDLVL